MASPQNPFGGPTNEDELFVQRFAMALSNVHIRSLLTTGFNEAIDQKLEPIKKSVEKIEECNKTRDIRVDTIERKLDVFEQRDKEKNIVITGLKESDINK